MENITWSAIIPLIGGFPLGAEKASGKKPEYILSYNAFNANDSNLLNNWKDTPYHVLDSDDFKIESAKYVDVVVATPPCSALSMLNCNTRSCDSAVNDWIYNSTSFVLENVKPKVLIGENAPGLYGDIGKGVVEKLKVIAKKYNYAFTLYKTTTLKHGTPQNRIRTFYFMWKSDKCPIINWYNKERKTFPEYLKEIPESASYYNFDNDKLTDKITNSFTFNYIKNRLGDDFRNKLFEEGYSSVWNYILKKNLLDDVEQFAIKSENPRWIHKIEHIKNKKQMGKGFWDDSIKVCLDRTNGIISKNISTIIHPSEDRLLNISELIHMMGMPSDFKLANDRFVNHISQNVPVSTAADMVTEAIKFVKGELKFSNNSFSRQNNCSRKIENLKRPGVF